jgi:CTP:molybdopterin cytidylyltransferase MocA
MDRMNQQIPDCDQRRSMISTVVLAAQSRRPPAASESSLRMGTSPCCTSILENVLASDVGEVICVTDDLQTARREINLVDSRLVWHFNRAASRSESASVIAGLWASHPESDGIIVLAELSSFRRDVIDVLRGHFESSQASIVAARSGDQAPNPILFRRELYPELLTLTGDDRGMSLLEKHLDKTVLLELPE